MKTPIYKKINNKTRRGGNEFSVARRRFLTNERIVSQTLLKFFILLELIVPTT